MKGLARQAVHLELNAFLCILPYGTRGLPAAPRLGDEGCLLGWGARNSAASFQSPHYPRPDEAKKGSPGMHEKLILSSGNLPSISPRARGVQLGDSEFQGKRNGPSLAFSTGPLASEQDLLFLLATRVPAPPATLKKTWGIVNSNFAG